MLLSEEIDALLREKEQNDHRIMELKARVAAGPIRLQAMQVQLQHVKDDTLEWNLALAVAETTCQRVEEMAAVMEKSKEVLRDCNELLMYYGSFKNPLLEQRQAAFVRLQKEWAEFKKRIQQNKANMGKENDVLKANLIELNKKLSAAREQKAALIKTYNELKQRDREAQNKVIVKLVTAKLENDAKKDELKNEESKLALLQIEKVKWKRGVEMKNLELVELKKRFETFSIEKNKYFSAKLDYIEERDIQYVELDGQRQSPTESESSIANTSWPSVAPGDTPLPELVDVDGLTLGGRNQGNNGERSASASGGSIEQSRQSILQKNLNRMPTNSAKAQSANKPPPNQQPTSTATHRFVNNSVASEANGDTSSRKRIVGGRNQGNDGRIYASASGASTGQLRQSVIRESSHQMPTNAVKSQLANKPPPTNQHPNTSATHCSVEAGQNASVVQPNIVRLPDESKRKRRLTQSVDATFRSSDQSPRYKRIEPVAGSNAGQILPEEQPPQPKKKSPSIQSASMTMPSENKATSANSRSNPSGAVSYKVIDTFNGSVRPMIAPTQKPPGQKQHQPALTGKKQSAKIDPNISTSAPANADSREQNTDRSLESNLRRSQSSTSSTLSSVQNGETSQAKQSESEEFNDSSSFKNFPMLSFDTKNPQLPLQTTRGADENSWKRNPSDGRKGAGVMEKRASKPNEVAAPPSSNDGFEFDADDVPFLNDNAPVSEYGDFADFDAGNFDAGGFDASYFDTSNIHFKFNDPAPGDFDYNMDENDVLESPGEVVGSNDFGDLE